MSLYTARLGYIDAAAGSDAPFITVPLGNALWVVKCVTYLATGTFGEVVLYVKDGTGATVGYVDGLERTEVNGTGMKSHNLTQALNPGDVVHCSNPGPVEVTVTLTGYKFLQP